MQNLSKYLNWRLAWLASGVGALINGGWVFHVSQSSAGANIGEAAQGIGSILAGIVASGISFYLSNRNTSTSDSESDAAQKFEKSMAAIQELSEVCKGCEESAEAIETLTVNIVKRLNNA